MSIDWLKLLGALALLLTPSAVFHGRGVHHRDLTRDWDGYWGRTLRLWTHGFDLVRAFAGGWLLMQAISSVPGAQGLMKYTPLALRGLIVCVATLLQTMVCKERDAMNAPIAFAIGLSLILLPIHASGPGLIVASLFAYGTHLRAAFFPVLAISSAGFGALFLGMKLPWDLAGVGAALILPGLLPVLFSRHLVCPHVARKPSATPPPPR
ncbi:MAG: hypothetical protein RLZZ221_1996 [Verrucomicrobiota bacterium]